MLVEERLMLGLQHGQTWLHFVLFTGVVHGGGCHGIGTGRQRCRACYC